MPDKMQGGYNLITTLLKLCLLTLLATECVRAYPQRDNRNESGGQFNLAQRLRNTTFPELMRTLTQSLYYSAQSSINQRKEERPSVQTTTAQSDFKFVFPEEEINKVPICEGTYCEEIKSYPVDIVNRAIERNQTIKYLQLVDEIDNSLEHRMTDEDTPLCMSIEHLIYPQSAKNKDNDWKIIVNQENFKQGVRVEKCRKENVSCNMIGGLAEGYRTTCKQKYVYRQLAALSPDGTLAADTFKLPSSCCCHVTFDSSVLTRIGFGTGLKMTPVTPFSTTTRRKK